MKKTKPTRKKTVKPKNIIRSYDKVKPPMEVSQDESMQFKAFEPKLNNRFIVKFTRGLTDVPSYVVKSIRLPSFFGNIDGLCERHYWDNVVMELYDPITPSTSATIQEYIFSMSQRSNKGYLIHTSIDFTITLLGPVADSISEWVISDCDLIGVNFGNLNWDSNEANIITLTLKPKNCILNY